MTEPTPKPKPRRKPKPVDDTIFGLSKTTWTSVWSAVTGLLVALVIAWKQEAGTAVAVKAAEKADKAADTAEVKAEEVKTTLEEKAVTTDDKLDEIDKVVDRIHSLVNGGMATQLRLRADDLRISAALYERIAELTQDEVDKAKAEAAKEAVSNALKLLHEHEKIIK